MEEDQTKKSQEERISSDPRLTRTQFLKQVLLAGGLAASPVILDKFLVQPAPASSILTSPGQVGR